MSEKYINEIFAVENEFALMASEKGIRDAFVEFAADSAVINRNGKLVSGKKNIEEFYSNEAYSDISLEWKPDFVDVSESGDLAYTFGEYLLTAKNESGEIVKSNGVFHTVWKRQIDGKWKFVWD